MGGVQVSNRRGMGCGTALVVLIGVSFVCYLAAKMLSPAPTPEERAAQRRVEAKAQAQQQAEQAAQREKAAAPPTAIERFEAVFLELNLRLAYEADAVLFRQATDGGGGRLYIDVTDSWLSGSLEDRRSNLDTIYDLWASSQQGPRTTPLAVWIRSPDARIVMRKP